MRRRRISAILLACSLCLCAVGSVAFALPRVSADNQFSTGYVDIDLDYDSGAYEILPGEEIENPAVITCISITRSRWRTTRQSACFPG